MISRAVLTRFAMAAALLLLAGCSGPQSALDPKGPEAHVLSNLFYVFLWVCIVVWVLIVAVLAWALARRRAPRPEPLVVDPGTDSRFRVIVTSLALFTGVTVVTLAVFSYAAQAQLFARPEAGVTIKVTGHQWWWEVAYDDPSPANTFTTANEIHVPVGEPITVKLTSADVIHSFWVPTLFGKMDAITGRENQVQFTADKPGVYRGQCAEFCGLQHAHMALVVFAEPREQFEAWKAAQLAPAPQPANSAQQAGLDVFLNNPCVSCHSIRGTSAGGRAGPDLTHLAGRTTIAADTLPFTRGALGAWLIDPQSTKPGANMPMIQLSPDDLQVLLDYLESLK